MGHADLFLEIPCVKQMRADPMPTASMIEAIVGSYLKAPPPGIYFRGNAMPVMRTGEVYHQHKVVQGRKTKGTYVVDQIEQLDRNLPVMDLDGNVVVTPHQIPFLSYQPVLPAVALQIVEAAVKDVVDSRGPEDYRRNPRNPTDLYGAFILHEEFETIDVVRTDHRPRYDRVDGTMHAAVIDQITEAVSGIRNDVKSFCGENPWVIHFLKKRHTELIIEKSIDWRIIEYHRMTNTKLDHYE